MDSELANGIVMSIQKDDICDIMENFIGENIDSLVKSSLLKLFSE